jgi:hypothetical protein
MYAVQHTACIHMLNSIRILYTYVCMYAVHIHTYAVYATAYSMYTCWTAYVYYIHMLNSIRHTYVYARTAYVCCTRTHTLYSMLYVKALLRRYEGSIKALLVLYMLYSIHIFWNTKIFLANVFQNIYTRTYVCSKIHTYIHTYALAPFDLYSMSAYVSIRQHTWILHTHVCFSAVRPGERVLSSMRRMLESS